jgi:hypothetical protein
MDDMPILSLSEGYWDKQVWQGFFAYPGKKCFRWLLAGSTVLRFRGSLATEPQNQL